MSVWMTKKILYPHGIKPKDQPPEKENIMAAIPLGFTITIPFNNDNDEQKWA